MASCIYNYWAKANTNMPLGLWLYVSDSYSLYVLVHYVNGFLVSPLLLRKFKFLLTKYWTCQWAIVAVVFNRVNMIHDYMCLSDNFSLVQNYSILWTSITMCSDTSVFYKWNYPVCKYFLKLHHACIIICKYLLIVCNDKRNRW